MNGGNRQADIQPLSVANCQDVDSGADDDFGDFEGFEEQCSKKHMKNPMVITDSYSEHLSLLHLKLYKETEHIRKWKITTEMDIQQKEKKLQDSLQIIESQRKSLLEVQLENEKLSLHLSEEIENRQEILEKLSVKEKNLKKKKKF